MKEKEKQKNTCAEMRAYRHFPWPQEEPSQGPSSNCFGVQIILWQQSHQSVLVPYSRKCNCYTQYTWGEQL